MPNSPVVAEGLTAYSKDNASGLSVFSTCPSSLGGPVRYLEKVIEVARWSEESGCTGILIYTDNSLVDPWLVAQVIVQNTRSLCPLVAVQPVYMHPYSVAKMVSSLALMHGRRVYLNMVAGGFKNDLAALNDHTPHDRRYQRLVEYTRIIQLLLAGRSPVRFEGQYYRVNGLTLQPSLPPELLPGVFVSGSSEDGLAAARELSATAIQYPEPSYRYPSPPPADPRGMRIGVMARPEEDEAWKAAEERFPGDRKGQITRHLATKVSDSEWHKRLSEMSSEQGRGRELYWLHPFENYHTNCPYLVGKYADVASELARYIAAGYRSYILDIPASREEFEHIGVVFAMASQISGARR